MNVLKYYDKFIYLTSAKTPIIPLTIQSTLHRYFRLAGTSLARARLTCGFDRQPDVADVKPTPRPNSSQSPLFGGFEG